MRRQMRKLLALLLLLGLGAAGVLAAGSSDRVDLPGVDRSDARRVTEKVAERVRDDRGGSDALTAARCPDDVADCRAVTGRIVYVERVDPDGDGDLHVVLAAGGITAPGLTSIDVRPGLRPERDPSIGDEATAAGPVQRGSRNQAQIHALTFRVGRQGR